MLETDYLVVGAGAAGMAFTDSLLTESDDTDVTIVDRRDRPGGHWNDAYPFVRLHQPAAYYGVNSRALGTDAIEPTGPNAGMYEQSNAGEIVDYFHRVLHDQLVPTGRLRFLGMHDHLGGSDGVHRAVSRLTGETVEIAVRERVVDARYQETPIPATHRRSFTVDAGATVIPVNELVKIAAPAAGYVLLGAGKTAMDACAWLLRHGVASDRITWIRPRDGWFLNRATTQPRGQVASLIEGVASDLEASAAARSIEELTHRLESDGRLLRLDPAVEPQMYRCATMSVAEVEELRCVTDVVRLGHVLHVGVDAISLDHGTVPTSAGRVHIDCTAGGLRVNPGRPVFEPGGITIQEIRTCQPTFNAAFIGFVEATWRDDATKNALCPPNPYPSTVTDLACTILRQELANSVWNTDGQVLAWMARSRLNAIRDMYDQLDEPRVKTALGRYFTAAAPAVANLRHLLHQNPVGAPPE